MNTYAAIASLLVEMKNKGAQNVAIRFALQPDGEEFQVYVEGRINGRTFFYEQVVVTNMVEMSVTNLMWEEFHACVIGIIVNSDTLR